MNGKWMWALTMAAVLTFAGLSARADKLETELLKRGFEKIVDGSVRVFKDRNASIVRVVAEGKLPGTPEQVRDTLLDYERQVGVIERLRESRVIERGSESLYVYQRLALPIISDRDFTLKVTWGKKGESEWIRYEATSEIGPGKTPGVVRITQHTGTWHLSPAPDGHGTLARFHVTIDMAGMLPKSLAKAGAGRDLPALYDSICRLLVPQGQGEKLCMQSPS